MAMQPVIKPQETKPAPLPAYPVAPSNQTQTSSRGMTPPKAYAGVPKSVPHYDAGTDSVQPPLPQAPSGNTRAGGFPHIFPAPFTPPAPPTPIARGPNGRVLYAPPSGPTASSMMAAPHEAIVAALTPPQHPQSRMGTPILNANPGQIGTPTGAPFQGTVARGGDSSLTPDPSGQYDVQPVGQPYASSPQQVATAAANTGANPAALQNVAGAARDAIANPTAHTPQSFADATRGISWHHLQMLAPMMHYDPAQQAYQRLISQQTAALKGMTEPQRLQQEATMEMEQQVKAGAYPWQKMYPTMQTNPDGTPVQ